MGGSIVRRVRFHVLGFWRSKAATCLVGVLVWAFAAFVAAVPIAEMTGCAVGRDQLSGDVVLGFKAGRLVETANQAGFAAAQAAGNLLGGGPLGQIAGFGLTAALGHFSGRNRGWDEREEHEKKKAKENA